MTAITAASVSNSRAIGAAGNAEAPMARPVLLAAACVVCDGPVELPGAPLNPAAAKHGLPDGERYRVFEGLPDLEYFVFSWKLIGAPSHPRFRPTERSAYRRIESGGLLVTLDTN